MDEMTVEMTVAERVLKMVALMADKSDNQKVELMADYLAEMTVDN